MLPCIFWAFMKHMRIRCTLQAFISSLLLALQVSGYVDQIIKRGQEKVVDVTRDSIFCTFGKGARRTRRKRVQHSRRTTFRPRSVWHQAAHGTSQKHHHTRQQSSNAKCWFLYLWTSGIADMDVLARAESQMRQSTQAPWAPGPLGPLGQSARLDGESLGAPP